MNTDIKKKHTKLILSVFICLSSICFFLLVYISSPLHPRNISYETVAKRGDEFVIRLDGISSYDEKGFTVSTENFYFPDGKVSVFVGEDGFAYTDYDKKGEVSFNGKYSSPFIYYDGYSFCGEEYKTKEELEAFFELPDPIYNFDINNLSTYIQNIIHYEKQFVGKATVKIYRGKCVITEVYIGEEKVLKLK
ncbi:MAG: hypothetical protein E7544_04335 [Ruminococcaceae bacterium]|nr:hypothetical protein [Oscillospiraceae bacterium]